MRTPAPCTDAAAVTARVDSHAPPLPPSIYLCWLVSLGEWRWAIGSSDQRKGKKKKQKIKRSKAGAQLDVSQIIEHNNCSCTSF